MWQGDDPHGAAIGYSKLGSEELQRSMGESEQLLGLLTCDFREFKVTKRVPGVEGDQSLKDNHGMLNIQSLALDHEMVP